MKKLLLAACVAALGVSACSSGNSNTKTADGRAYSSSSSDAKYQIIDQEFDNMLAPETDYDSIPAYELQACGDSYLPPADAVLKGAAKPSAKKTTGKKSSKKTTKKSSSSSTDVTKSKKVINNTNIYYINSDSAVPASSTTTTYTSEEALPDTL